VKKEEEARRIA